jgi:hypothetical protein
VLTNAKSPDPFSLQLTFVVHESLKPPAAGAVDPNTVSAVQRVIREETPAHLVPYLLWVSDADFLTMQEAYNGFLAALNAIRREQMGIGA